MECQQSQKQQVKMMQTFCDGQLKTALRPFDLCPRWKKVHRTLKERNLWSTKKLFIFWEIQMQFQMKRILYYVIIRVEKTRNYMWNGL